jgi:hypothetical protein
MGKNEVKAPEETFDLVTLDGDFAEAIAEEMEGLGTIPFDRVRIPAGGSLAFELPGETEDDTESVTELKGVILDHNAINAYWPDKYSGGNEPPSCTSYDGKTGTWIDGSQTSCENCPRNQFKDEGGKDCKNMHRLYMLREGNPVPLILTLPPTSIKFFKNYIAKRILLKGLRCYKVITKITLKKEKSKDGIQYSHAVFSFAGNLSDDQIKSAEAMKDMVRSVYRTLDIGEETYEESGAPKADDGGFMAVPDDELKDGELPFD